MDKPFRRILLIKMRFHGDMLLTTPVISSLKKNYPDAKIDVLLYQDTIPILSENPEINALYGIKKKKQKPQKKLPTFFHLIKVLRANKYDLIVNLTDQWMVAILVRLLNARVKISRIIIIGRLLFGVIVSLIWCRCRVEMWWKVTYPCCRHWGLNRW